MPVLKVKKNGAWEEIMGGSNSEQLNGGNADTLDGKHASDFANASHTHTITASASDDDVVVLTGTNGTNKVTYSASHANSGVTAGTYKSVTVNAKGHVTGGSNPTTLSGYGITDGASKTYVSTQINNALANFESGKTLTQHLTEEDMILTSRQYGDTLPTPEVPGRIFFKRVFE